MKILLYYSSHRQKEEFLLSSDFFNKTNFLKKNTDIIINCDNDHISVDELKSYIKYETSVNIIKSPQIFPSGTCTSISGNGIHIGVSESFNLFDNYDYVIVMTPDCYITNEDKIEKMLIEELNTENQMIVDFHDDWNHVNNYSCDFFVFKPKFIPNFFKEVDMENLIAPEIFLKNKIIEKNIKCKIITREGSLSHQVDNYGLIHNHDLNIIRDILNNQLKST